MSRSSRLSGLCIVRRMERAYAVRWREPDGKTYRGRLEVGPAEIVLDGRGDSDEPIRRAIAYRGLRGFRIGRSAAERLDDRPALVVERDDGDVVVACSVLELGVLQELVHQVSRLRSDALQL